MKSILQKTKQCFLTHDTRSLDKHHVFNGPMRDKAEQDGLYLYLRHDIHMDVHNDPKQMLKLKAFAQSEYEKNHTREEFMARYHKNYL